MTEEIDISSKDYIAIAISYGIPNENIPKFVMDACKADYEKKIQDQKLKSELEKEKLLGQSNLNLLKGQIDLLKEKLNNAIKEKLRVHGLMTSRGVYEQYMFGIADREMTKTSSHKRISTSEACVFIKD